MKGNSLILIKTITNLNFHVVAQNLRENRQLNSRLTDQINKSKYTILNTYYANKNTKVYNNELIKFSIKF